MSTHSDLFNVIYIGKSKEIFFVFLIKNPHITYIGDIQRIKNEHEKDK